MGEEGTDIWKSLGKRNCTGEFERRRQLRSSLGSVGSAGPRNSGPVTHHVQRPSLPVHIRVLRLGHLPLNTMIVTRILRPHHNARLLCRSFSAEPISHSPTQSAPPPPPPLSMAQKPRTSRLNPSPRRLEQSRNPYLSHLPPTFGKNQLLPVADSTRALLESIVSEFNAPIRYAFAYGSGVFEQDGYSSAKKPMIDFVFAVNHPSHWHSINMSRFPGHYPLYSRALGSDFVSRVQEISPGLWFNAYVPMNGVVCQSLFTRSTPQ